MKLILGRLLSILIVASGWIITGIRTVLDMIGYATVPDDAKVAQGLVEAFLLQVLSLPVWLTWGFALVATLWLMWVSWPRQPGLGTPTTTNPKELTSPIETATPPTVTTLEERAPQTLVDRLSLQVIDNALFVSGFVKRTTEALNVYVHYQYQDFSTGGPPTPSRRLMIPVAEIGEVFEGQELHEAVHGKGIDPPHNYGWIRGRIVVRDSDKREQSLFFFAHSLPPGDAFILQGNDLEFPAHWDSDLLLSGPYQHPSPLGRPT